ncbi:zinc-dependent metalloprotease [Romeriopsis navalis]|uniref:zinc-dependent metalloprotease n=1 Tax=Romeriopsis navalis TaxID=2992132 RepID=UPI0021F81F6B|nr:zinc-dependent metalloprotease [Romeriopsis navalis]
MAFALGLTLTVLPLGLRYVVGLEPVQAQVAQLTGKKAAKASLKATQSSKALARQQQRALAKSPATAKAAPAIATKAAGSKAAGSAASSSTAKPPAQKTDPKKQKSPFRPFDLLTKDTEKIDGLFTLYRDEKFGRLYAEIRPDQLETNHLMVMTLESAVGEKGLYSGLPLGDFMFKLQRVNNTLQLVVPNTYVRADRGTPRARALSRSFSDSVLQTLPIRSIHKERKSLLVEMNPLLLGDLPGLATAFGGGYGIDAKRSYVSQVKNFEQNTEMESVFGFTGGDGGGLFSAAFSTLPDSRAFDLRVRYSISKLPAKTAYQPRLADDRIGYFITAFQDFNKDTARRPFVRYINRWHLEKKDAQAALSAPKEPIVFWLENTIPVEYRQAMREGALMWNKAFEAAGFKDAVVVKQMPERADWDPADVRYNTIRWFNSTDSVFAMGPSRVNPLTGEILDADIVVDGNFVRSMKQEYRNLVEQNQQAKVPFTTALLGQKNLCNYGLAGRSLKEKIKTIPQAQLQRKLRFQSNPIGTQDLCYGIEASQQFALGAMNLSLMQNQLPSSDAIKDYVNDFLRELVAHEVGHTLGLRHNFRGSAMLQPKDLNNTKITRQKGLVGSVMDYNAVNLAPQGTKQGDYYTHIVGPYDKWAIEYGYKPSGQRSIAGERRFLGEIASRSAEPDLAYATDEDVYSFLDPKVNLFDMSGDGLTYAKTQMDNARAMWERVEKRYPLQGESFSDLRTAFNGVFNHYWQSASLLTNYVGGQSFNRYRYGDAKGRLPFEAVPLAEQRRSLELIRDNVFDETKFKFSPTLLNKLAPSRWSHWGTNTEVFRLDYPIFENVLFLQAITMYDLLSPDRLARLRDGEFKAPAETMSIPELFDTLQSAIWGEVLEPKDGVALSSLRRALQREHMNAMTKMILRQSNVPDDARTVARYKLRQLERAIKRAERKVNKQDIYTLAHLEEARDRISKALNAPIQSS